MRVNVKMCVKEMIIVKKGTTVKNLRETVRVKESAVEFRRYALKYMLLSVAAMERPMTMIVLLLLLE